MKFYETKATKIEHIEDKIFGYANIEKKNGKMIIRCDHCGIQYTYFKIKRVKLYYLTYQIIVCYPDRGDFLTDRIEEKTLCGDCCYVQHMIHKVLSKKLINNIN